jgi:hypothetical protein
LIKLILALALAAIAAPVAAQGTDEVRLLRTVRAIGDATAGQTIGSGQAADKIVFLGRGAGGIVVTSVAALVPGAPWVDPPAGAIAALRTRASSPAGNQAPAPADIAFVRTTGLRVFIVGEGESPPAVRELARQGQDVRVRAIDPRGAAGPWQAPAG